MQDIYEQIESFITRYTAEEVRKNTNLCYEFADLVEALLNEVMRPFVDEAIFSFDHETESFTLILRGSSPIYCIVRKENDQLLEDILLLVWKEYKLDRLTHLSDVTMHKGWKDTSTMSVLTFFD